MDGNSITLGLAVLAGMASFLSPCVLSLVPAYVGYLGGRAATVSIAGGGQTQSSSRWLTFSHGLAFVGGFSVVFILLGISAGLLGALFGQASFQLNGAVYDLKWILSKAGGLVVIVFGLHTMGVLTIPFLDYDTRQQVAPRPELGYASSAMMGVFFSAGWSPCVGPVLGALLTLALTADGVGRAAWLLVGYSLGLAVPFLLAALAIGQVTALIRKYSRYMRIVSIVTGVMLVIIGVMLLAGTFESIARFGFFVNFGI
jgi:cytochrome c-type biogenesis protein